MNLRCVILDDYQNIALTLADWSTLSDRVEVHSVTRHFENEDELVNAINQYEIIVIMRERTPFPKTVLTRFSNIP